MTTTKLQTYHWKYPKSKSGRSSPSNRLTRVQWWQSPFRGSMNGHAVDGKNPPFRMPKCWWYCWWFRNPANQSIGSLSHYLQGFIHTRWLFGISSINSTTSIKTFWGIPSGAGYFPWATGIKKKLTPFLVELWDPTYGPSCWKSHQHSFNWIYHHPKGTTFV